MKKFIFDQALPVRAAETGGLKKIENCGDKMRETLRKPCDCRYYSPLSST